MTRSSTDAGAAIGAAVGVVAGPVIEAALATTVVAGVALHLLGWGSVDPGSRVISDYVVVPGGYALLAVAAVGYAVACMALAGSLASAGLPRPELPAALLAGGATGFLVAAVFPTNVPGTPVGVIANVHRAGGAAAFVLLPLAGWLVARRAATAARWRSSVSLRRWSAAAVAISVTYLTCHIPIVIGASHEFPYIGGVERVLCAAVLVVLFMTARATRMAIGGAHVTGPEPAFAALSEPLGGAA